MEIEMKSLPIMGILILMLLVISGYGASEDTQALPAERATWHADPHVYHYQEHLIKMGIERRQP